MEKSRINPKILHLRREQLLSLATYQGERIKRLEAKIEAKNEYIKLLMEQQQLERTLQASQAAIDALEDELMKLTGGGSQHLKIVSNNPKQ